MPARKIYRLTTGQRCLTVPIDFYPTARDLIDAVMWHVDRETPWPKTQKAVLEAYRERVRSYGLQDFNPHEHLYLEKEEWDDDGHSNKDELIAALEERATKIVTRLFPDLQED